MIPPPYVNKLGQQALLCDRSGVFWGLLQRFSQPHAMRFAVIQPSMIRRLQAGEYRLYSRKKDPKTGRRRNLGTFKTRAQAEAHERAVQYFKRAR